MKAGLILTTILLASCGMQEPASELNEEEDITNNGNSRTYTYTGRFPTNYRGTEVKDGAFTYSGGFQNGCLVYGPYKTLDIKGEYSFYIDFEMDVEAKQRNERRTTGPAWDRRTVVNRRSIVSKVIADVAMNVDGQVRSLGRKEIRSGDRLGRRKYGIHTEFMDRINGLEIRLCEASGTKFDSIKVYSTQIVVARTR